MLQRAAKGTESVSGSAFIEFEPVDQPGEVVQLFFALPGGGAVRCLRGLRPILEAGGIDLGRDFLRRDPFRSRDGADAGHARPDEGQEEDGLEEDSGAMHERTELRHDPNPRKRPTCNEWDESSRKKKSDT